MSGHVVSIVRVCAKFAACRSYAGFSSRAGQFERRSRYNSLSPSGHPSGWLAAGEGPTATILKRSVQLSRDSFSLRTF